MKVVIMIAPSSSGKSAIGMALNQSYGWHIVNADATTLKNNAKMRAHLKNDIEKHGLDILLKYMDHHDLEMLWYARELNINKGSHEVSHHRFEDNSYEGLEVLLRNKGFTPEEIGELVPLIMKVGESREAYGKEKDLFEQTLDEAFDPSIGDDECVYFEMVPEGNINEMITTIVNRAENDPAGRNIEIYTIMAYSPPMELSERNLGRNEKNKNNPEELRIGKFPFQQLSKVVSAATPSTPDESVLGYEVSQNDFMKIAYRHSDEPRGPKPTLKYAANAVRCGMRLARDFGLKKGQETATLAVKPGVKYDKVINTSAGTPKELADQVVEATKTKRQKLKI